jgi:hypothetical protein
MYSILNCLCMLILIKLENPNVKELKNTSKITKEKIQMYI